MELRERLRAFHLTGQGLEEWLPPAAGAAPPQIDGVLELFVRALETSRGKARAEFLADLRKTVAALEDLLAIHRAHADGPASSQQIGESLGAVSAFFRTSVLKRAFERAASPSQPMDRDRRERCEEILRSLRHALREEEEQPPFFLFHSEAAPAGAEPLRGCISRHDDPCPAACEFSRQALQRRASLLRDLRAAHLEIRNAFDARLHAEALARFDWQSLEERDLIACTPIIVWEPAERLTGETLGWLARLLRSGQPIQVITTWSGLCAAPPAIASELGLSAMMHREALVLQSALDRADHLRSGIVQLTASTRPSLAIVAAHAAALMYPPHCFDPGRGTTLREHLEIAPDASQKELIATIVTERREDLRMLPDEIPGSEVMEWTEYLDRFTQTPPLAIPVIRVTDFEGHEQRAVVTRALIHTLRERRRAGQMLTDMSGGSPPGASAQFEDAKRAGASEAIEQVLALLRAS